MSDASLTIKETPNGPPETAFARSPATRRRPAKQIGRKLKVALDGIVWSGHSIKQAAEKSELTTVAVRSALAKPHVQAYLRQQRQVFRESARGGNIHRAVEIRDQDENRTAAMQAVRYLDGLDENERAGSGSGGVQPGVVVQVNVQRAGGEVDETIIEVNPAAPTDSQSDADDPQP